MQYTIKTQEDYPQQQYKPLFKIGQQISAKDIHGEYKRYIITGFYKDENDQPRWTVKPVNQTEEDMQIKEWLELIGV